MVDAVWFAADWRRLLGSIKTMIRRQMEPLERKRAGTEMSETGAALFSCPAHSFGKKTKRDLQWSLVQFAKPTT
jgi:hypothetical protein